MKKYIIIEIDTKSKSAMNWAIECLEIQIKGLDERRKEDTDDPNIDIKLLKEVKSNE